MATETLVFAPPESLTKEHMHYCPGCTHGIIHRLVAEIFDELDVRERVIGICPVGCSVLAYKYFNCDMIEAAHGRAPAVATGLCRALPDSVVFTYQGDGDLASIGMGEIIHAASRNERMTVIFVNNAVFGMTQGQTAPTTLLGQKTSTAPFGRRAEVEGFPIRMCELLATLDGPRYVARVSSAGVKRLKKCKAAIKKAFQSQIEDRGFGFVEILANCPTFWGVSPLESLDWVEENMVPYYPLGEFTDRCGSGAAN